jgi:hypothetical protein
MGRDSGGFRSDLGRHETRLFLRRGLDRQPKSAGAGNQLTRAPSGRLADLSDFVAVSGSFEEVHNYCCTEVYVPANFTANKIQS